MKRFFGLLTVVEPWDASGDSQRRVEVLGHPIGGPTQLILLLEEPLSWSGNPPSSIAVVTKRLADRVWADESRVLAVNGRLVLAPYDAHHNAGFIVELELDEVLP